MKIILDNISSNELKRYLLTQDGINNVEISDNEIDITFDERTVPETIIRYINLFENNKWSELIGFDKTTPKSFKTLKYVIADMCCEYCYKHLVQELFMNENIKSVKSNFKFSKPAFNIEFIIEYNENYSEIDLIKYIKENN